MSSKTFFSTPIYYTDKNKAISLFSVAGRKIPHEEFNCCLVNRQTVNPHKRVKVTLDIIHVNFLKIMSFIDQPMGVKLLALHVNLH